MTPKPPIFLFAFSNDKDLSLKLAEEERAIREALQNSHDTKKLEYHSLSATTLDDIYRNFNRFHNRVHFFHYAGHSNHTFLELVDRRSRASNLSVLIGMQKNLKLVFLNGCGNRAQVTELFEKGVKVVIATAVPIWDDKAVLFSATFYQALAGGKTIQEAFEQSAARLKEDDDTLDIAVRSLDIEDDDADVFPWGLYAQDEADLQWVLPDPYEEPTDLDYFKEVELNNPDNNRAFVELVFEGMAKVSRKYQFLLDDYRDETSDSTSIYDLQEEIYKSFPSILGIQIRDLFATEAKTQGRLRLREINEVYLVLGKLLSSIALASLWQAMVDEETMQLKANFKIRDLYKTDLKKYLEITDEDDFDYFWLLSTIGRIFVDNEAEPFITELKVLEATLTTNPELYDAYQFLEFDIKRRLLANNIASMEVAELCSSAAHHLGQLLHHCAFLITYQLVSVNDISVRKLLWASEVDFVHRKILLRGVEDTIRDRDPLLRKSFTCNHAVIVTKNFKSEDEPLILAPFVIDENAYKIKGGEQSKIYFWAGKRKDGKHWYQHTEVMTEGLALPTMAKNVYRDEDLQNVVNLIDQFAEHLQL